MTRPMCLMKSLELKRPALLSHQEQPRRKNPRVFVLVSTRTSALDLIANLGTNVNVVRALTPSPSVDRQKGGGIKPRTGRTVRVLVV